MTAKGVADGVINNGSGNGRVTGHKRSRIQFESETSNRNDLSDNERKDENENESNITAETAKV